ncbi:MAG: PAS domain S-box protein, partial [Desulfobulbaceae bacterium]|nr:PAS domain S-box protein [Desulfobulbaceae bacterium]
MTQESDKNYHNPSTQLHSSLFSFGNSRLRFCLTVLIAIFIIETILMVVLSLLPPMPSIIIAIIDALLLMVILSLIFWPQLKKEMTFHSARFSEAQETLLKSEARYRALVESTEDSIYLVNRQYCYIFMNQKHLARLGYSTEEFFGRPYSEFHAEEETHNFEAAVDEVFAMGKSIQQEHQSKVDHAYFLRTLSPVRD